MTAVAHFLTEQRALLRELEYAIASVQAPILLLADPRDTLVPLDTVRRIARALPDAACNSSTARVIAEHVR